MSYRIIAFLSAKHEPDFEAPAEAVRMAATLFESARRCDSGVKMTVLSDLRTRLPGLDPTCEVIRYDFGDAGVMMARTNAQLRFVDEYDFALPLAFLDIDILVNRSIGFVFSMPFDIGVTVRRKPQSPINGGVILANNRAPEVVRAFFRNFASVYATKYSGRGEWWGDQEALNDIVGTGLLGSDETRLVAHGGFDYVLLPAWRFNHSPHWLQATLFLPRLSRYLLHFKGAARKKYLEAFYRRHIAPRHVA